MDSRIDCRSYCPQIEEWKLKNTLTSVIALDVGGSSVNYKKYSPFDKSIFFWNDAEAVKEIKHDKTFPIGMFREFGEAETCEKCSNPATILWLYRL